VETLKNRYLLKMLSVQATLLTAAGILIFWLATDPVSAQTWHWAEAGPVPGLGPGLTPVGAIRAGNAENTICPWTGGIEKPPPGYVVGRHHLDPFAADEPLFTINGKNAQRFKANLSEGQQALLCSYPGFLMKIYPCRRTASFPGHVYQAIVSNHRSARLIGDGDGVEGAVISIPFPVPQDGREAIWNHLFRYRGESVRRIAVQTIVAASGGYFQVRIKEANLFNYARTGIRAETLGNILFYYKMHVIAPPSSAGYIELIHETINKRRGKRTSWAYIPGARRVIRLPQNVYDTPTADGVGTNDQVDMFNGAIDRYNWRLLGKRELFVPYNAYGLHRSDLKYADLVRPKHIDTRQARYELHRVWEIEATLKEGKSHIYPRRMFYLDEDSWQALIIDHYDKNGKIWRVAEGHVINYYEVPLIAPTLEISYDLKSGRYFFTGYNEARLMDLKAQMKLTEFRPNFLRQEGVR